MQNEGRLSTPHPKLERMLVALILRNPKFFGLVHHLVSHIYFSPEYQKPIRALVKHYKQHKQMLDRTALEHAAGASLKLIYTASTSTASVEYYLKYLVDFIKSYKFEQAIFEAAAMVDKQARGEHVELSQLQPKFKEIFQIDVIRDLGSNHFETLRERMKFAKDYGKDRLGTGFPLIDRLLDGGVDVGEILLIMAGTNVGKTMTAINIGKSNVLRGKHVLHSSLEMSEKQVSFKYDMAFCKMTKEAIQMSPKRAYQIIKNIKGMNAGKLIIQDMRANLPSMSSYSAMLHAYILEHGVPDVVITDSLDLFRHSISGKKADYNDVEETFKDARSLMAEIGSRLVSPTQANRGQYGEEITELGGMSQSLGKAQIADMVLALCQSKDEKAKNLMRIHVAKSREGPTGALVRMQCDFARSTLVECGVQ